ncbi:MAG: hypothetical protein GC206_09845 [Alphaproteobacteria bacterium]|nr:hypothetical protein [Alphaproteobacteria bacterium]
MKVKLAVAALALGGAAAPALADNSFNFEIEGSIPVFCEATNNSLAAVETLATLDGTEYTLGSITYTCNLTGGFTRTISSGNGGTLNGPGSGTIPYTVSHGGGSGLGFSATSLASPKITALGGSTAFIAGQTGSFRAAATAGSGLFAGAYDDVVTVAVVGN